MAPVVTSTTIQKQTVWGTQRVHFCTLALDTGDYAAGGVAVTPAQLGLTAIDDIIVVQAIEVSGTPTAHVGMYNPATGKIRVFQGSTAADGPFNEKGAEAFGSGANFRIIAIGR